MAYFDLDVGPILERCGQRGDVRHVRHRIRCASSLACAQCSHCCSSLLSPLLLTLPLPLLPLLLPDCLPLCKPGCNMVVAPCVLPGRLQGL